MPLVPQASGPRKDRDGARPTKKGRQPLATALSNPYSAVIPGRREATNPE
jgi:hypothetical protein